MGRDCPEPRALAWTRIAVLARACRSRPNSSPLVFTEMLSHRLRLAAIGLLGLVAPIVARAENWPQWRGPNNDGISHETGLPTTWSKTENVAWRLPLPGPAGSTPVVWNEHIFLTSAKDGDLVLICASTAGRVLWERQISTGDKAVRGDEGNSASPSPVTDGRHVWTFMANGPLACYDFAGQEAWQVDLQERYGKFDIQFGMTSTPVLDGDRLYLQLLHSGGAHVVALDKATGKEIWHVRRPSDAYAECEHSYASPVLYRDKTQAFLITHGCDYVVAHDLDSGRELWRCGGLNLKGKYNPTLRFVASPVTAPGLIVVPSAKNGPVLGLRPDARGDITEVARYHAWTRNENTPDVPSPLVVEGLVYLCRENGILIVLDAQTGEELYQQRTHNQRHRASPVFADGKVYLMARDGVSTVVKAGRTFEKLARNELGEDVSSSLAIAHGTIYIRSYEALYAIRNGATAAARGDGPTTDSPFNGKDFSGWVVEGTKDYDEGGAKQPVWTVHDGQIECAGKGYGFLRLDRKLRDFVFGVEFRMAPKCNSGIGLRGVVFTGQRDSRPSFAGYEIQLLDDAGTKPTDHSTGSLYRYVAATADAMKPAGEWNRFEVECRGPRIRIAINGVTVQDVDQRQVPAIKDKPLEGYLSLQNHGGRIAFRNLTLVEQKLGASDAP